jgi:hypothetical protein
MPTSVSTSSVSISAVALALLVAAPRATCAQAPRPAPVAQSGWELLVSSGALVPTGVQRGTVKGAALSTAQLSYVVRSRLAVTTTVGWARSRDLRTAGDPRLSVFTYDLGVEARAPRWRERGGVTFTPFAGAGAGGRSYDHRGLDVDATHALAGYAAAGGEFGTGRVRLRVEARDYVAAFRPLVGGGASAARNDVMLLAGLRITRRHASD